MDLAVHTRIVMLEQVCTVKDNRNATAHKDNLYSGPQNLWQRFEEKTHASVMIKCQVHFSVMNTLYVLYIWVDKFQSSK